MSVLLSPFGFTGFSAASMLSPTGRCRVFSAEADGYVRAEGGGVVALKLLTDALADGDRIHGVILASGVNSDGSTTGLALPSAEAQAALLEQVYAQARVTADDLSYFEAHGTGTPVGDPIECDAIGRALGARRTVAPLPIGSVKSNTGHLEAASGMAGLLKALLVLRHRHIPATLHAQPLSPHIDFHGWKLDPCTEDRPLDKQRPVVGVNSFGFGGSNAHAVLAAAPSAPAPGAPVLQHGGLLPVVVSARTPEALEAAAGRHGPAAARGGPGGLLRRRVDSRTPPHPSPAPGRRPRLRRPAGGRSTGGRRSGRTPAARRHRHRTGGHGRPGGVRLQR